MKRLVRKASLTPEQYIENYPNGYEHVDKGIKEVNVDNIIGSSFERKDEYDNNFQPVGEPDDRWKRLYEKAKETGNLSFTRPVNLVQVPNEEKYFVYDDGNHRVSVAKTLGISTIQANITVLVPKDQDGYADYESKVEECYSKIKSIEQQLKEYNMQQQNLYNTPGKTIDEINKEYDEIEQDKEPMYKEIDSLYAQIESLKQQL